jgi:GTP diphosphokinase / guanosine-3',5'-bis(diphosphate) 3'-diphosphatase
MNLQSLISEIKKTNRKINVILIKKAYLFAEAAHEGQKRASGEPYIKHPLNVAHILVKLGMDESTIAASLLHDVIEDTNTSYEILEKEFGQEIASLVEGVTKVSNIKYLRKEETNVETLRKVLLATSKDIRVMIIKLADRLHNMRTLDSLPKEKQLKIAKETLEVYSPIAYRLGIMSITSELEDLSFKYLQPNEYQNILKGILTTKKEREKILVELKKQLESELKNQNITARLQYRVKNIYSIYKKIQERNYDIESIRDLIALRVITKTVKECYEVLGIVHNLWKPMENGIRDYIATPRSNMYQSIHTNVITNHGLIIEIQIRTEEMHKIADSGIAAHWKYKGVESDERFDKRMEWLKEVLSNEDKDSELLETLKIELFGEEIFVFTPKGKVIDLPVKSTPLDFAYKLHSDIGDHCIGSKVNGNFVPLNYELKNGDIIEIITQKNHKPSRDWLKFVKTSNARQKIRKKIRTVEKIPIQSLDKKSYNYNSLLEVKNIKNAVIKFAHCCNPLPNDRISALLTANNVIHIHKINCEILKAKSGKLIDVSWIKNFDFIIKIKIIAEDRISLFADLLKVFSNFGINIEKARANISSENRAECHFDINAKDIDILSNIIKNLNNVPGVKKISLEY